MTTEYFSPTTTDSALFGGPAGELFGQSGTFADTSALRPAAERPSTGGPSQERNP